MEKRMLAFIVSFFFLLGTGGLQIGSGAENTNPYDGTMVIAKKDKKDKKEKKDKKKKDKSKKSKKDKKKKKN